MTQEISYADHFSPVRDFSEPGRAPGGDRIWAAQSADQALAESGHQPGHFAGDLFVPAMVSAYAGSLVLVLLGLYYIAKWGMSLLRSRARRPAVTGDCGGMPSGLSPACRPTGPEQTPRGAPADCAELLPGAALSLSLPEVLTLSLTLSLNNLSAGLSASLAGLALVPAAIATFVCSVVFLEGGNRLGGCRMLQLAGCAAEPVSGILLIGLGMVWLFW